MVGIAIVGTRPDKLNEWGDFFAGFFAPLAFLWLVIGYLQQGEELRQSSEALRLQAAELKSSVEQQTELVKVSRQQIEQDAKSFRESMEIQSRMAQPQFTLTVEGAEEQGEKHRLEILVKNHGNTARDVVLVVDDVFGSYAYEPCEVLTAGQTHWFVAEVAKEGSIITVGYLDIQGVRQGMDFDVDLVRGAFVVTPVFEEDE